ncbi:hypothetical protein Verru16b_01905 [Lacunisphaera limnophila]|uniref:Uncharacterized protein n=1 Tax=Lacunisphaera limnophila TaxID=1838286 RepID=A0A1D8AVF5_9BACT|nr:hypothetical protein [Lacunisphaera limnophila]AOS44836.1 hypothetical protein Verru16b_01905 [Lacunisphaera limnophila]
MDFLDLLTRRAVLLPLGVCLIIAGFVMRGIARSSARSQANRRHHELLDATPADPSAPGQPDAIDRHLEKFLPRYASATIWLGLLLATTGFFR